MNSSRRGFLLGMLKVGVAAAIVPAASLMRVRPIVELTDPGHVHGVAYYDLTKGKPLFPESTSREWIDRALTALWDENSITPTEIHVDRRTWRRLNGLLVPV